MSANKLATITFAALLSLAAFPTNRGLVTDDAHVFTQAEVSQLEAKLRAFEQASSVEFAVVTVTSLDGMSIDEYRAALFKAWGIGKRGKDNGVLMVVAPNEPPRGKVGIEVGYGLEGLLNDAAVGTIIRERIVPGWRSSHRADGLLAGADAIIARLSTAPAEAATSVQAAPQQEEGSGDVLLAWFVMLAIIGGVTLVVVMRMRSAKRAQEEERRRDRELWRAPAPASHGYVLHTEDGLRPRPPASATAVQRRPEPRREERRREEATSYTPATSSYSDDTSSRISSGSSFDSGSSSSSSYDFGGGSSGGGGSSSDL